MNETETPFTEKTCPLIDRKCIRGECVAYSESKDIYYVSNGSEELEIMVPYKDGKRDKLLSYRIFEANIDQKITDTHFYCKNYKLPHMSSEIEEVNEELFTHGESPDAKYKGLHVSYKKHNTDSKTAIDGKWEHNHNV